MNHIGLAIGGLTFLLWAVAMYAAAKPAQPVVTPAVAAFSERFPVEQPHILKKQDRFLVPVEPVAVAAVDIVDAGQLNAVDLTAPPEPALELAQDDPEPAPRRPRRNERNEDRNVCTRHHLRKVWVTNRRWRCR